MFCYGFFPELLINFQHLGVDFMNFLVICILDECKRMVVYGHKNTC